jgi:hypothetical protein
MPTITMQIDFPVNWIDCKLQLPKTDDDVLIEYEGEYRFGHHISFCQWMVWDPIESCYFDAESDVERWYPLPVIEFQKKKLKRAGKIKI